MFSKMMTNELFNRYSISYFDFTKAIQFATETSNFSPSSIAFESLLTSAIITYCRPFSLNERGLEPEAAAKLLIDDFQPLTTVQLDIHKRLVELRNKAIAHSEYQFNPTKFNPKTAIISSMPFSVLNEVLDIGEFILLTKQHIEICHQKRAAHMR
jgi:hypothetical protein